MKTLIAFMAFASVALAQSGTLIKGGSSLPGSCTGDQVFNKSGTAPGIYQCSAGTYVLNAAAGGISALIGDVTASGTGSVGATVVKVNGVTVTGTPSAGQVIQASGSTAASWQTPAAGGTLPFALSNTSTVITIGASNPSGVPGVAITATLSVNAQSTFTVTGGTGTVYIGLSGGTGGTTAGTVTVNHNITGNCSGCTAQSTTPAYDDNMFQIGQCSVTSGAITSCTSAVTSYRIQPTVAATGLTKTVASGVATWAWVQPATITTGSNCSSSANPAVCASASAGSVSVAAASTSVVINTTAVTVNSQIFLTFDASLGTKLSVTCNTTVPALYGVSARTAATSFTITSSAPTTNPACFSYTIVN